MSKKAAKCKSSSLKARGDSAAAALEQTLGQQIWKVIWASLAFRHYKRRHRQAGVYLFALFHYYKVRGTLVNQGLFLKSVMENKAGLSKRRFSGWPFWQSSKTCCCCTHSIFQPMGQAEGHGYEDFLYNSGPDRSGSTDHARGVAQVVSKVWLTIGCRRLSCWTCCRMRQKCKFVVRQGGQGYSLLTQEHSLWSVAGLLKGTDGVQGRLSKCLSQRKTACDISDVCCLTRWRSWCSPFACTRTRKKGWSWKNTGFKGRCFCGSFMVCQTLLGTWWKASGRIIRH